MSPRRRLRRSAIIAQNKAIANNIQAQVESEANQPRGLVLVDEAPVHKDLILEALRIHEKSSSEVLCSTPHPGNKTSNKMFTTMISPILQNSSDKSTDVDDRMTRSKLGKIEKSSSKLDTEKCQNKRTPGQSKQRHSKEKEIVSDIEVINDHSRSLQKNQLPEEFEKANEAEETDVSVNEEDEEGVPKLELKIGKRRNVGQSEELPSKIPRKLGVDLNKKKSRILKKKTTAPKKSIENVIKKLKATRSNSLTKPLADVIPDSSRENKTQKDAFGDKREVAESVGCVENRRSQRNSKKSTAVNSDKSVQTLYDIQSKKGPTQNKSIAETYPDSDSSSTDQLQREWGNVYKVLELPRSDLLWLNHKHLNTGSLRPSKNESTYQASLAISEQISTNSSHSSSGIVISNKQILDNQDSRKKQKCSEKAVKNIYETLLEEDVGLIPDFSNSQEEMPNISSQKPWRTSGNLPAAASHPLSVDQYVNFMDRDSGRDKSGVNFPSRRTQSPFKNNCETRNVSRKEIERAISRTLSIAANHGTSEESGDSDTTLTSEINVPNTYQRSKRITKKSYSNKTTKNQTNNVAHDVSVTHRLPARSSKKRNSLKNPADDDHVTSIRGQSYLRNQESFNVANDRERHSPVRSLKMYSPTRSSVRSPRRRTVQSTPRRHNSDSSRESRSPAPCPVNTNGESPKRRKIETTAGRYSSDSSPESRGQANCPVKANGQNPLRSDSPTILPNGPTKSITNNRVSPRRALWDKDPVRSPERQWPAESAVSPNRESDSVTVALNPTNSTRNNTVSPRRVPRDKDPVRVSIRHSVRSPQKERPPDSPVRAFGESNDSSTIATNKHTVPTKHNKKSSPRRSRKDKEPVVSSIQHISARNSRSNSPVNRSNWHSLVNNPSRHNLANSSDTHSAVISPHRHRSVNSARRRSPVRSPNRHSPVHSPHRHSVVNSPNRHSPSSNRHSPIRSSKLHNSNQRAIEKKTYLRSDVKNKKTGMNSATEIEAVVSSTKTVKPKRQKFTIAPVERPRRNCTKQMTVIERFLDKPNMFVTFQKNKYSDGMGAIRTQISDQRLNGTFQNGRGSFMIAMPDSSTKNWSRKTAATVVAEAVLEDENQNINNADTIGEDNGHNQQKPATKRRGRKRKNAVVDKNVENANHNANNTEEGGGGKTKGTKAQKTAPRKRGNKKSELETDVTLTHKNVQILDGIVNHNNDAVVENNQFMVTEANNEGEEHVHVREKSLSRQIDFDSYDVNIANITPVQSSSNCRVLQPTKDLIVNLSRNNDIDMYNNNQSTEIGSSSNKNVNETARKRRGKSNVRKPKVLVTDKSTSLDQAGYQADSGMDTMSNSNVKKLSFLTQPHPQNFNARNSNDNRNYFTVSRESNQNILQTQCDGQPKHLKWYVKNGMKNYIKLDNIEVFSGIRNQTNVTSIGDFRIYRGHGKGLDRSPMYDLYFNVMEGSGKVDLHGEEVILRRGEYFHIPKGEYYEITNVGDEVLHLFFVKIKTDTSEHPHRQVS